VLKLEFAEGPALLELGAQDSPSAHAPRKAGREAGPRYCCGRPAGGGVSS
jgi:hypothetical protein